MRLPVVLAVLGLAWPAEAQSCRHYSVWRYPWPQPRCGVRMAQEARLPPLPPARTVVREEPSAPVLEPLGPAPVAQDEAIERALALKALKIIFSEGAPP